MASQRQTGLTSRSPFPNAYALSAQGRCKDSELNSKFKIINSKSNNALAHAPLYYCIAFLAREYLIFLCRNQLNELQR